MIESCIQNKEFADAHLYASTLWEIINHKHDNKIPVDRREAYIARGAYHLAQSLLHLAQSGGIPSEEKPKIGQEAIALLRRALEINTQRFGERDVKVAHAMCAIADALDYFNDVDDDEVIRLLERSTAIFTRVYGAVSVNAATSDTNVGGALLARATRANAAHDLDREQTNLNLALLRFVEASRIFRIVDRLDMVEQTTNGIAEIEAKLRWVATARTALAAAGTRG